MGHRSEVNRSGIKVGRKSGANRSGFKVGHMPGGFKVGHMPGGFKVGYHAWWVQGGAQVLDSDVR